MPPYIPTWYQHIRAKKAPLWLLEHDKYLQSRVHLKPNGFCDGLGVKKSRFNLLPGKCGCSWPRPLGGKGVEMLIMLIYSHYMLRKLG